MRTWLHITDINKAQTIAKDANMLANLEGLHGHATAAAKRIISDDNTKVSGDFLVTRNAGIFSDFSI